MKKIIEEELNYIKYLFDYQKGKVISEQKKIISEQTSMLPTCPTDATELSRFIQVDDINSNEAKFYLTNIKSSNKRQKIKKDYNDLKNAGVFFEPVDKNFYLETFYPNEIDHRKDLIEVFKTTIKLDESDFITWLHTDGTYRIPTIQGFSNNQKLKEKLKDEKKKGDVLYFAIWEPIKPVCLKTTNQIPNSGPQQEPVVPTPMKQQCGLDLNWTQTDPTEENKYVMYDMSGLNTNKTTGLFRVVVNGFKVPDMVYVKYGNKEFLSSLLGYNTLSKRNFDSELTSIKSKLITNVNEKIAEIGGTLKVEENNLLINVEGSFWRSIYLNKNETDTLKIIIFSPFGSEVPQSFNVNLECVDK